MNRGSLVIGAVVCGTLLLPLCASAARTSNEASNPLESVVSRMDSVGPLSEERYQGALKAFLASPDAAKQLVAKFDSLPEDAIGSRWRLVYLASQTPAPESVDLLERVALSSPRRVHPIHGEGEDITYVNRLAAAIGVVHLYLDGEPTAELAMTRLLESAEPELARMMALELFTAQRLTHDEQLLLMRRGIDARFRKATAAEFKALTAISPQHLRRREGGPAKPPSESPAPLASGAQNTALPVDPPPPPPPPSGQPSGACGVSATADKYDSFYAPLWGCSQSEINDMWAKFHFDDDDWDEGFGYADPCNNNLPLKRTFNALQLLKYGITAAPSCDLSSTNPGTFAYCWAGSAIDELDATCDDDVYAWTTWAPFVDHRTDLQIPFYYDETVVERAGTIFHEARHAQGWCTHTDDCADGEGACDPDWANGCVGFGSDSGKGANGFSVIYLTWFARTARASWTTSDLRSRAVYDANYRLARRFDHDPCFRLNADGSYYYLACYFGF